MAHSGWPTFVSVPANSTPHTARGAGRSKSTGAFFRYRIILRPLRCSRSGDPGGLHRDRYHSLAPPRVMGVTTITFPVAATAWPAGPIRGARGAMDVRPAGRRAGAALTTRGGSRPT